jgi:hypothetical protein
MARSVSIAEIVVPDFMFTINALVECFFDVLRTPVGSWIRQDDYRAHCDSRKYSQRQE